MSAAIVGAADTAAVRAAMESLQQARKLYGAGVISQRQLAQAERAVQQAQDDAVLSETLHAQIAVEDLTEELSAEMTGAAQRRLEREQGLLAGQAKLVAMGVVPRTSLQPFEEETARARRLVEAAEQRARSLGEIAAMIRAEQAEAEAGAAPVPSIAAGPIQRITRFVGDAKFGQDELKRVVLDYEKKFDAKLPISAKGDTALHRSMGFDHRGRVDVALNPEQVEGRWLMRYLEKARIPFFAFVTSVRGQATAPHIHIGPPSQRYRASD